jgi:hypothetical protein
VQGGGASASWRSECLERCGLCWVWFQATLRHCAGAIFCMGTGTSAANSRKEFASWCIYGSSVKPDYR